MANVDTCQTERGKVNINKSSRRLAGFDPATSGRFSGGHRREGHQVEIEVVWHGGYTLAQHLSEPDVENALSNRWSYVIIQERTKELINDLEGSSRSLERLVESIRGHGAVPVIFENWVKSDSPTDHDLLAQHTERLKRRFNIDGIPIRSPWENVKKEFPEMPLHTGDKNHANVLGVYIAAWVLGGFFFGELDQSEGGKSVTRDVEMIVIDPKNIPIFLLSTTMQLLRALMEQKIILNPSSSRLSSNDAGQSAKSSTSHI